MRVALLCCVAGVLIGHALSLTVDENTVTADTRACLPPYDTFPFCDTSLSIDDRVNDLISRVEDDEIPPLLTAREGGGGSPGPPGNISRLGLPEFDWGVNCIHGVQTSCVRGKDGHVYCPTTFPNPVNYGATFNQSQFYELGRIIGQELRALWLAGATEESSWSGRPHAGLDCWSPNININRDPRWGRNQEVPSEDPYVNGLFGTGYTIGLQEGEDKRYIMAVVTLKHWDAYSLENSDGYLRDNFNAIISNFTLQDTYFPAFKASVIEGRAKGVMCSYNAVNGVPTCASSFLTSVIRGEWGFDGYITSDTGAIQDIYDQHKYVKTGPEAACVAIRDGTCDINSGAVYHDSLLQGVAQGNCSMDDVKKAMYRSLKLRFQLGLFDPIETQPYWHYSLANTVATQKSNDTALLATLESMVLLQNANNTLPFETGKRIAVIGPLAISPDSLVGNYLGQLCVDDTLACVPTIYEKISEFNKGGITTLAVGTKSLTSNDTSGFAEAVYAAKNSDYVVLVLGINGTIEAEAKDRTSIDLPYIQHNLAKTIAAVGKPTVLVLVHGGMVGIVEEVASIPAILDAHYPGMQGGAAVAMTIFGQNDHLGGKLPYTLYPKDYVNQIKMSDMEMASGPGRTYRYYTGVPTFPFGYGLSLTTFGLSLASNTIIFTPTSPLTFTTTSSATQGLTVAVSNLGSRIGDEVVFWYVEPTNTPSQPQHPVKTWLFDFKRVHLDPTESEFVTTIVSPSTFKMVDKTTADWVITPGAFDVVVTNGVAEKLRIPVLITGQQVVVERFPGA